MFAKNRAPGSEYFRIDRQEAIRKFKMGTAARSVAHEWLLATGSSNGDLYGDARARTVSGTPNTHSKRKPLEELQSKQLRL